MFSKKTFCATALLAMFWTGSASAGFAVDGSLSDWGISFDSHGTADYSAIVPPGASGLHTSPGYHGAATVGGRSFQYHIEDQSDSADLYGHVGPNHGGQDYDSEFLGVGVQGSNIFVSILTGQRPDNPTSFFSPGDLRILMSDGSVFGVEFGGGVGGSTASSGFYEEGAAGTTYSVDQYGYTTGSTEHISGQVAGSVWKNTTWTPDPIDDGQEPIDPQLDGGTYVGDADFIYSWLAGSPHAVFELSLAGSLFGDLMIRRIEWSPSCGNDVLHVEFPQELVPPSVPEPSSLALLTLGGIGTAFGAYRKRKKTALAA